ERARFAESSYDFLEVSRVGARDDSATLGRWVQDIMPADLCDPDAYENNSAQRSHAPQRADCVQQNDAAAFVISCWRRGTTPPGNTGDVEQRGDFSETLGMPRSDDQSQAG